MSKFLKKLTQLANTLDESNLIKEANVIDKIIQKTSAALTWTVAVVNEPGQSGHWTGIFSSLEDATAYAKDQAAKSRKFFTYQVYTGTPKNARNPVGEIYRGQH